MLKKRGGGKSRERVTNSWGTGEYNENYRQVQCQRFTRKAQDLPKGEGGRTKSRSQLGVYPNQESSIKGRPGEVYKKGE